ncbi:hypothetical protein B0H13DRAFT_1917494 [Mycena leptocephala]|nr:hypothetical protein B0H13DRAFT_1917494 [Mycena leptocephala]
MPHSGHSPMILFFSLVGVVLLLRVQSVTSQVAPSSWNLTLTTSTAERIRLAGAALDTAIDRLGADGLFDDEAYVTAGHLYSFMAEFDIATNQTKYQSMLEKYWQLPQTMNAISNSSDPYPKIHAVKAYAAYKNPIFLQYAVDSWWFGRNRTLSQSDISAGRFSGKNYTIAKACQNATMAGGTFNILNDPEDANVAGVATGLSALLAEITPDPQYLQAADESANFIHSHLYNIRNIVQDYISTDLRDNCQVQSSTDPSSSGVMVEGLSILSSITNNGSTQKILSDLIAAMIPNTAWHSDNGIVTAQGIDGGLCLLRGLSAFYMRNSTNATLRRYVGDFMLVQVDGTIPGTTYPLISQLQFNAVTNLATANDTNIYSGSWTGPPSAIFSGTNQNLGLSALISAIGLETVFPSSPSTSPTPTPSLHNPEPHKTRTAAILGGALGGFALVALVLAMFWVLHQRPVHQKSVDLVQPFRLSAHNSPIPKALVETFPGGLPTVSQYTEKHRRQSSPAPSTYPGSRSITVPTDNTTPSTSNVRDLPTEELVQLLNQRLQNRQWDETETPPGYPAA